VSGRAGSGPLAAARDTAATRPDGLTPLPRRVPQTSLAVELREDARAAREEEDADAFTADHAASSLAGFQRGTLRARDEDGLLDTPQAPASRPAPVAVPKKATAHGADPLDAPDEAGTADPNGPPGAPPAPGTADDPFGVHEASAGPRAPLDPPVAARSPHTDRS
jgi:hypothetical protein